MYSCEPLHMDDQLEPTYSNSVTIRGVALRTCQKQCTTEKGSEGGSGISMLMARLHDDDNDDIYIYIYIYILIKTVVFNLVMATSLQ